MSVPQLKMTAEQVQEILTGDAVTRKANAERYHTRAVSVFGSLSGKEQEARGLKVATVALDTYLAEQVGVLLPPKVRKGPGVDGMSASEWAESYGLSSSSNVNHWRPLGYALAVVGVPVEHSPHGEDWTCWQLISQITKPEVYAAIYAEGATVETIMAVCLTLRSPKGKVIRPETAAARPDEGDAAALSGEQALALGLETDPVKVALDALGIVAQACKVIPTDDREGWSKVESALNEILTRENTTRQDAAKAAKTAETARKAKQARADAKSAKAKADREALAATG